MNLLGLGKIAMLISAIICFSSCKTLEVIEANKTLHIAGLPNLNNYFRYSFIINSKDVFTVKSINLVEKDTTQKIEKYSFVNLKNAVGHTVLKDLKKYEQGNYLFSFRTDEHKNLKEFIHIEYIIKQKKHSKKLKITTLVNRNNK